MGEETSVGTRAMIAFGMGLVAIVIAYAIFSFKVSDGQPIEQALPNAAQQPNQTN